jgi:hypothetical protein
MSEKKLHWQKKSSNNQQAKHTLKKGANTSKLISGSIFGWLNNNRGS